MSWRAFVIPNFRFLAFGFSLAFLSSFGQTFFISLFNDPIRETFDLSHTGYGQCYSLATLASGLTIIWLGRRLDDIDLRMFSACLGIGLAVACLTMAWSPTVVVLTASIFLLRLTGQGLLSHTAMTSMARYYDEQRGKAMSIAGLGHPAGEAILPVLAVLVMEAIGWRQSWLTIGLLLAVLVVPFVRWLLRGHAERHRAHLARLGEMLPESGDAPADVIVGRQWTRAEMVRDVRFYLTLPAVIAPGFIVTGVFFHQAHLVEVKGWTLTWFAACFAIFAGAQLPASLAAGPMVDRLGARRLLPGFLLPLTAALVTLAFFDHPVAAAVFMALGGVTSGIASPIVGSMWAEVYGVRHLGAIRALITAILVFGTAGSPFAMGWLIDVGISLETMALGLAGYTIGASLLARLAMSSRPSSAV